jgi:hypothetical protein
MWEEQGALRTERNQRFHYGTKREFSSDDQTFRSAAIFETRGVEGKDRFGRRIDLNRSFKEVLVGLQRDFDRATRKLVRELDELSRILGREFESRFIPRFRSSSHGF